MDELKGIFKNYKPSQKYSEAFKRAVVKEFEEGSFSKDFIQDKYGLGGNSVLLNWCRKYGKFAYPKNNTIGRPMKDPKGLRGCGFFWIENDQIVYQRGYWDKLSFMEQQAK